MSITTTMCTVPVHVLLTSPGRLKPSLNMKMEECVNELLPQKCGKERERDRDSVWEGGRFAGLRRQQLSDLPVVCEITAPLIV